MSDKWNWKDDLAMWAIPACEELCEFVDRVGASCGILRWKYSPIRALYHWALNRVAK